MKSYTKYKIVYCTPALYMAGGVERVLTLKANYFADVYGYDITIIVTDGEGRDCFFPLSPKVKVVNLGINFEEMWNQSFLKRLYLYLPKEKEFKRKLSLELNRIKPDMTISLLRREINFLTEINDGSKKIGEIHINRAHYRNFSPNRPNPFKTLFSKYWMHGLVEEVKRLDRFVVLTEYDKEAWKDVPRVDVIPNPLPFSPKINQSAQCKRVISVGRYSFEKGYDMLLYAWKMISDKFPDWRLDIYGEGNVIPLEQLIETLKINRNSCSLHGRTTDIEKEYINSSLFVCSSRFEGFGMGIVEAMACGLPVVSFDCPWGPRSIITNNYDGLLVEKENVSELKKNMMLLMGNSEIRNFMGQNAIKSVQRFNIEQIAQKWKELFDDLCLCSTK